MRAADEEGVVVAGALGSSILAARFHCPEAGSKGPRSGPKVVGGVHFVAYDVAGGNTVLIGGETEAREGEVKGMLCYGFGRTLGEAVEIPEDLLTQTDG